MSLHTDVLRQALREDFADADDEELEDALAEMVAGMDPAEAFNFAKALNQIGHSAGQLLSDPAVASVVRTAAPIAGGALGTVIGGPVGTALGTQLGSLAAGALPTRPAPRPAPVPAAPVMAAPAMAAPVMAAPFPAAPFPAAGAPVMAAPGMVAAPGVVGAPGGSAVAGGSPAAAQAIIMANQRDLLQGLLQAALGQYGKQTVGGVPVAQLLSSFGRLVEQAAADADELSYLYPGDDGESFRSGPPPTPQTVYTSLVDADHLELAEALDEEWD
ncbi:hypothetical protein ACQPZX_12840 [Actinoplanes sp. CA-142083]|uniref:hypothetical protein n=1 Tax=Actinoplanes sp. CA-142083 TaxID=3239903 RepID=UPI003D8BB969